MIDRRSSGSLKWDAAAKDELALWVADMDFSSPKIVLDALRQRLEHPILGYARVDNQCLINFSEWCERRQGWKPALSDLVLTGGMLSSIGMALQFFTKTGDAVVIQTPVYHPFSTIPGGLDRRLLLNPLVRMEVGGGNPYRMDLTGLRELFQQEKPSAMVLCSPHNPVGRVWTREELEALLELCVNHQVLLISDEIHADIVLADFLFVSVGELIGPGKRFEGAPAIVLQAPSKSFNIPGLPTCLAYVAEPILRQRLRDGIGVLGMSTVNVLSQVACAAAYGGADLWMDEILGLIDTNYRILDLQIRGWRERWPRWSEVPEGLQLTPPEGTYLAWVRILPIQNTLKTDTNGLQLWFRKQSGVYLSSGRQFGLEGEGYLRFNLGTHERVLTEALERMQTALDTLYEA